MGLIAPSPQALARASDATVRAELETIVKSERFQTELPVPKPPPPKKEKSPSSFTGIGDAAYYLLIGIVAIGALYILYTLAQQRIAVTRRGAAPQKLREATQEAAEPPSAAELADAEAAALSAADAGRFEEAIHALLLGAIGRLREKNARAAARSLTSREILSRVTLAAEYAAAESALHALVASVEISRFGGRPVDRAAFERCLEAYRAFRQAVGRGSEGSIARRVAAAAGAA